MKGFLYFLFLTSFLSTGAFQTMPSQSSIMHPDSSQTDSASLSQNFDIMNQLKKSNNDCELTQVMFDSKIKTFEPDTTLTASTPILKPASIDKDIFAPGFKCQR